MASVESDEDLVFYYEWKMAIEKTIENFGNIKKLKSVQEEALLSFIKRRDVLAVLPTGSGKSLIFQLVPGVVKYLSQKGFSFPEDPIILVVCPLNALIDSHIKELKKYGVSACCLTDHEVEEDVKEGKFSVVFANPESLVDNKKWRSMLQSEVYQKNVFGLVTDEAHVIPKWGKKSAKERKAAFRQCFFRLGEVRSLLPVGAPVLALTATATEQVRKETVEELALKPDVHQIVLSPDRPNIYLYKAKVSKNLQCFKWLITTIQEDKLNTPKTIVYCKSQKQCGQLYRHFRVELGANAYYPDGCKPSSKNCLIGMFHANTLAKHKERVAESLFDSSGNCRVIFATTALGMGINVPDIRQVIHFGPPREMDDFVQEIGRAGRDGLPAKSILLFTGRHLVKCTPSMKDYANGTACLRETLLKDFGECASGNRDHECCSVCHAKCQCAQTTCAFEQPSFSAPDVQQTSIPKRKRKVTSRQKEELKELLLDYQKDLETSSPGYFLSSQSTTGFTNALVKSVSKNLKNIFCLEDIIELTPVYKKSHAIDILFMIRDVCEDFEIDMDTVKIFNNDEELNLEIDYEYGGIYENDDDNSDTDDSSGDSVASDMSGLMEL